MGNQKILVVDDDNYIRLFLQETLEGAGYELEMAEDGADAFRKIPEFTPDLVLTDLKMPKKDGLELLESIQAMEHPPGVIIITAYGTVETAVQAMKAGAFDYLTKPFSITEIESRLNRFFELTNLRQENRTLKARLKIHESEQDMVGQSEALKQILSVIEMVAMSDAPVFIQGESGTGKELVANAIHRMSDRSDRPFLQINCAAIPENLMESTLFGHVQGAFTGASKTTKGLFEEADSGTLLLDEISEIQPGLQAKLLRVLQEQKFAKVGSHKPIKVDVRILATTNQNILDLVEEGKFREDLYYRLNVVPLPVPPLRDRKGDVPLVLDHFVTHFCNKYQQPKKEISPETLLDLEKYHWPGNVREVKNTTERAVLFAGTAQVLKMEHFFPASSARKQGSVGALSGTLSMADIEKQAIIATLKQTENNRTQAARILDISVKTLRNKLKLYDAQEEHSTASA